VALAAAGRWAPRRLRRCTSGWTEALAFCGSAPRPTLSLVYLYSYVYDYGVAEHSVVIGEALFALSTVAVGRRDRTLSLTGASTLATLERSGPRRLTDLAATEGVTQPSMTALVRQLENLGLAERRSDGADARVVLVAITAAGRRHRQARRSAGAAVLAESIDQLGERESQALRAALPALLRLARLADDRMDVQAPAGPASGNTEVIT
jgi:DNA-binding MarR family transcriptional regulator